MCSAYLLEPDRANLVLAATLGLRRECIGTLRMALHEGLAGLVAEQVRPVAVEQVKNHPRFKYFSEAGEDAYQSFLGVPLIDRGVLQGVLVVQTMEARVFREDEIRMLTEAAAQVAPVVSEARTLDRFIAPAQERLWALARNLWWSWDHDSASLFRDLDPVRWRQLNHNPVSLAGGNSAGEDSEARAAELVLHSRINYAYRRQREYLQADRTWGARHAGVLRPRPVAYFSAEFGLHESLPVYSGGLGRARRRSHQERVRSGHSAGRHRTCFTARDISGSGWIATAGSRKNICRPTSTSCRWSRRSARTASRSTVQIETRSGSIRAKVWRVKVGRCDLLLLDSECGRQRAGRSRADFAPVWRRRGAFASARNCCWAWAASAR